MNRRERREWEREQNKHEGRQRRRSRRSDIVNQTFIPCQFPRLFGTEGCCTCGHPDLQQCPCTAIDALRHQEKSHQDWGVSREVRSELGCLLPDSEPLPRLAHGQVNTGTFESPCGLGIAYATSVTFPSMAHYRWHSIFDHLDQGDCQDVDECGKAIMTGEV